MYLKPNTHHRRDETVVLRRVGSHRRCDTTVELCRVGGVNTPVGSRDQRMLHHTSDSNVYKHAASYVTSYPTSIPLADGRRTVNWVTADSCVHTCCGSHRRIRRQSL